MKEVGMLCTCLRGKVPCPEQATHWAVFKNKIREGWEIETRRVMCGDHAEKHRKMTVYCELIGKETK